MKSITIKITYKEFLIAIWDKLELIKFKSFPKNYAKKINLISMLTDIEMNNIVYFDSTGEYNYYFNGTINIKLDRKPIKSNSYKNLKHQLYFTLIDYMKLGKLNIACEFPKDEFKQQCQYLVQNKYSETNKLEIISRRKIIDELGNDIDLVDLLSYRFFSILKGLN